MANAITDLNSLLVSKPGYRNGWPCLRGSGITVHNVGVRYSQGVTVQEMCEENPHLHPSLFYAAVAYYLANRDLIEQQLDEVSAWGRKLAALNPRGTTGEVVFSSDQVFSLYMDEDSSNRSLVAALRRAGFDCLTTHEAGLLTQSDENQQAFAASQEHVLYTMNIGDFARLHNEWMRADKVHSGLIIVTEQHLTVGLQLRALQNMAVLFEPADMVNRREFLLNYAY